MKFILAAFLFLQTQQNVVTLEADRKELEGTAVRAIGNVVLTYEDIRIEADVATYDQATGVVTAGEGVRFTRGDEHLEASRLSVNILTKTGSLTGASGALGPGFFITAAEAVRTGDGRYRLKNATVTTCEGPHAGWTYAAGRATIDPRTSVAARNSVFRFEGIPIFYFPYIYVPALDRERSTGFLIPSTSTSTTKGRSVRASFYWAMNRSADATFTGEYFSKRGPAGTIEFRAVPEARSRIEIRSFFAQDRKGQGGQSTRILTHSEFGRGFRGVADMNIVSSFVFRQVYEEGLNVISSPIEHSLAYLTRNQPDVSVNMLYNRTAIFFVEQPTVVLRKFPTLEVLLPHRPVGRLPLYFSLEGGLAGIARRDAAINTPTFVQRFDLHPVFEIPILRTAAVDWSNRIGVRETAYSHSRDVQVRRDVLNRLSFDYTSHFVGPQIERRFGAWKHVVEPSFQYRYVTGVDRFHRTILVDEVDLLANTHEVEYALTNRLFAGYEFFSWRLSQKYFLDPTFGGAIVPGRRNVFMPLMDTTGFSFADGTRKVSPIVSTMRISTSPSTSTDIQVDYDTRQRLFRSAGIIGQASRGHLFGNVSYFFTRRSTVQIPNNQLRTTIGYGNELKPGLSAAVGLAYDIERTLFQGSTAQVGYNTDCYGINIEFTQFDIGARKESRIRFALSLKNIGSYGTIRRQERLF